MNLGDFSISLNVKSVDESVDFYQKLDFKIIDGGHVNDSFPDSNESKWRIIENNKIKIGLFQGMFDQNILTFNPKDVLSIQNELKDNGIVFISEANEKSPHQSAMLNDPDGNLILFDQM